MWSVPKGTLMGIFSKHGDLVTCGGFSHDGKHFISCSADSTLIYWDPKTLSAVWKAGGAHDERWHQCSICSYALSHDERVIATGGEEGSIRLSLVQNGKTVASYQGHEQSVEVLLFCSGVKYVISD
jgi:hypothetical protein